VKVNCPHCAFSFDASGGRAGRQTVCPRCREGFDAFAVDETVRLGRPGPPEAGASTPRIGSAGAAGSAVGLQFEEYRIVAELGRGGMGVVYKAEQETLDRPVALKVILAGGAAGPEEIKRFLAEAAAAARLRHPNIVTVHELDVHEGTYYYTMDFIEGRSLDRIIDEGPLDPRRAAEIAGKVARALQYAHRKGIVHRDLKPGNVLIDEAGEPMITDFGLAFDLRKVPDDDAALAAGTPGYMAPEQVLGVRSAVGPACDIYSLGALLYDMLTGLPPFSAANTADVLEAIVKEAPVPPGELRPDLDRALAAICTKCLEKRPEDRWASAAELAEALAGWLRGEPADGDIL